MPADVIMPALGLAQETGKVVRWLKEGGDTVIKGEPLLEIETDKVTVEIEAPADGVLAGIRVAAGADVPVGEVIAVVLAEGESVSDSEAKPSPTEVEDVSVQVAAEPVRMVARARGPLASPKARRLAEARGIDLEGLVGTGSNGAIVAGDVKAAMATQQSQRTRPSASNTTPPGISNAWRVMAERTQRSWQEIPHFYLHRDVDASRLLSWKRVAPGGTSVTDLLVKVCAQGLRDHPRVNANDSVNVGIAVATEEALVVPVLHQADELTLSEISARRKELVKAARAGKLRPADVQGGTFTISNLGMFGVDSFQAIVNAPQAAILAVGRTTERPWVSEGRLVVQQVMTLSLSFDHRMVDGARGAEFLDTLASLVEEPAGLIG